MLTNYERSIVDIVLGHGETRPDQLALVFDQGNGPLSQFTYAELAAEIRRIAAGLVERGMAGRHVALLFTAGTEFVVTLLACLAAGSVAIPLAPVGRRRARLDNLLGNLKDQKPDCLIVDQGMADLFGRDLVSALETSATTYLEYEWLKDSIILFEPLSSEPNQLAVLQYTSGTTGRPKGTMITHGNIIANESMIRETFGHDDKSNFVGWVPHYHDQGLFGNILQPLFLGSLCVIASPAAFINKPLTWLQLISTYRAHTSGGPNFGYDLCADIAARRGVPADIDLSSWKVAFNGAERINATTLERFANCFASSGFRKEAFLPCYGLAESTLVTVAACHSSPPTVRRFDSSALSSGIAQETATKAGSIDLVCCGPAMGGSEVAVVTPGTTEPLPDGKVGEIWLRGPHIAAGYLNDEEATRETFGALLDTGEGPFLRTGDLGFSAPEGIYIMGRLKDVINVRGRKFAPSDIEQIWSRVSAQVGQANAAAAQIEVNGQQHITLISEMKRTDARNLDSDRVRDFAGKLRTEVMEILELGLTDLIIVPEGKIPRTTSGKVQRTKAAQLVLDGEIPILAMTGPLEPFLAAISLAALETGPESGMAAAEAHLLLEPDADRNGQVPRDA